MAGGLGGLEQVCVFHPSTGEEATAGAESGETRAAVTVGVWGDAVRAD